MSDRGLLLDQINVCMVLDQIDAFVGWLIGLI
jgi:hypothetical protein